MENQNPKILIADDSSFMRKILQNILKEAGFSKFIECKDGKECISKFKEEKPDLVLLDIIMPEMSGIEVAKKIGKKTNIIIISANGQDSIKNEAKEYGVKGYIIKPFKESQIIGEIQKIT